MKTEKVIQSATQTIIDHVDELTALDQAIGDGDHGLNMRRGALAIQARMPELATKDLNAALIAMGMTCMSTIGGSSGPVFGTLLVTLGKELPANATAQDLSRALGAAIEALTRLGKAQVGQKTLLDVLDPVRKVLLEASAGRLQQIEEVERCAFASAEATANMQAGRGRSSFLGERALGHVDPGSRSIALIISSICKELANQ
jgi:phosphoenolpyruvate---glycerone phosphotransferase subunit DhaL